MEKCGGEIESQHEDELETLKWVPVGMVDDFPYDGGGTIKHGKVQIAVYRFSTRGEGMPHRTCVPHTDLH